MRFDKLLVELVISVYLKIVPCVEFEFGILCRVRFEMEFRLLEMLRVSHCWVLFVTKIEIVIGKLRIPSR